MTARRAADWWHALDALESRIPGISGDDIEKQKKKWQSAVDQLGRYLRSAVNEDRRLSRQARSKYRGELRKDPVTGDWQLFLPVTAMPQHGNTLEIMVPGEGGPSSNAKIIVRRSEGWRLFPYESEILRGTFLTGGVAWVDFYKVQSELIQGDYFSPHTAAVFQLFHDLHMLGPNSNVAVHRLRVQPPVGLWAYSEWGALGASKLVLWPCPGFVSFWEHDIFLSYWNEALSVILESNESKGKPESNEPKDKPEDKITRLVYAWMDAGAAVLARDTPDGVKKGEKLLWRNLVKNIATLVEHVDKNDQPFPMGRITQEWLIRLSIFLPDLSGVPKEVLPDFCRVPALVDFWCKRRNDIKAYCDNVIDLIFNKPENASKPKEVSKNTEATKIIDTREAEEMKTKRNAYLDTLCIREPKLASSKGDPDGKGST